MKPGAGLCLGMLTLGTLALVHCDREAAKVQVPAAKPEPAAAPEPWRWHFVGGLLVVEGELDRPTELKLKGRYLSETARLPLGPVRWELYRPPPGEVAELRSGDGALLARWDFDAPPPPPPPAPVMPVPSPAAARATPPAKPVPPLGAPAMAKAAPPQAPPKAAAPPPPAPKPMAPPVPAPMPRAALLPVPAERPRPWAMTEPHWPLPKSIPAKPMAKVAPPLAPPKPVAPKLSAPQASAPTAVAAKPVPPPAPWARTEPHWPLPRAAAPPLAAAKPSLAPTQPKPPTPAPAPSGPPVAKVPPSLPRPAFQPPPAAQVSLHPVQPKPPAPAPPVPLNPPLAKVPPSLPKQTLPLPAPPAPLSPPKPSPAAEGSAPMSRAPEGSSLDWPGAGEGLNLLRGPKGERRICMTFDGGSTAEVAIDVLDVLKAHGIRTTIFLTGDFIQKYPDLVLRIVREGHEVGNHTLTHPHMAPHYKRDPLWTRERMQKELLDADRAFYRLVGRPMDPYWRPPFGEQTAELRKWAEEIGYRTVSWSEGADTLDWTTVKEYNLYRNGSATIERLEKRMNKSDGDGLIVLMHLGSMRPAFDRPAKYLGPFMDRAIKAGWHFVPVSDYLKSMGRPAWDPARRLALMGESHIPVAP